MTIGNSVNKKVVIGLQSVKGTIASAALATAQILRFLKFTQNQTNESYTSNEMRPDKQIGDVNIGPQEMPGSCSGELSPKTYDQFMAAILRKAWVAGEVMDVAATDNVAAATTSGAAGTFTRDDVSGDFLEDGFKIGDVVRWTGWDSPATANNAHNMLITALTDTIMTVLCLDGQPVVTRAKGDSVGCSVVGKKNWIPATGHTEDWFSIEHYYSDLDISEVFIDCKVSTMAVKVPASGIPTIDFNILGLDMTPELAAASPYFSGPLPITVTEAALSGKAIILVQGVKQVLATGIDFDATGNNSVLPAVIGTNVKPGISDGRIEVKGNISLYFENVTMRDYFRAGTAVSIYVVLPVSDLPAADFIAFSLPSCVLTGASKDGDKEIIQTIPFSAKFNSAGGTTTTLATLATTLSIQDSAL
jgi:hypothetical protein